jgi:hypothetical protein
LFDGGDTNLYGYVLSDPVNFVDPFGRSAQLLRLLTYLTVALLNPNNAGPVPTAPHPSGPQTVQGPSTSVLPISNPGGPQPLPEPPGQCFRSPGAGGGEGGPRPTPPPLQPKPPGEQQAQGGRSAPGGLWAWGRWVLRATGDALGRVPWLVIPNVCMFPGMCGSEGPML